MLWKQIPEFSGYEVSEYGAVRHGARHLKPERVHGNGRKRFSLSKGSRVFRFKAAQLVALAFIGPKPFDGAEVCHNDGFELNDHYSNLRWDTHTGNMLDASRHRVQRREQSKFPLSRGQRISAEATQFLARHR